MRHFLNSLIILFSVYSYAAPPVIWYGNDAKFINSGSIIVPGIGSAGVCTADGTGKFATSSFASLGLTGSANTLASYDASGNLHSSFFWGIDPDVGSLTSIVSIPGADSRAEYHAIRTQANLNGTVTGSAKSYWFNLSGSGSTDSIEAITGNVSADTINDMYIFSSDSSGTVGGNAYGFNMALNSTVVGNLSLLNVGANNTVGGNFLGLNIANQTNTTGQTTLINASSNGNSLNGFTGVNTYNNGPVTNSYFGANLGNDGTVSNNATGVNVSQQGDVTKSFSGINIGVNANLGDGSGQTANGALFTLGSGKSTLANLYGYTVSNQSNVVGIVTGFNANNSGNHYGIAGYNFYNNGSMIGANTVFGAQINNSGAGYRFTGASVYNDASQSEEIRGFQYSDVSTNSRTKTGLDITMSGNTTDDAQGIRVNVNNQTSSSTTQHVFSGQFYGGLFTINGDFTPFNGTNGPVDVGNYFSVLGTIQNGSPLTSVDTILQLAQSNLLVHDNIATGPIGLDTNLYGIVSQIGVDSGKTVPLMRSLLLGTSVPSGAGGTITEHHVLGLLGLPSFGGSVSNPTRIGIIDEAILGQNFCDGASTCYIMKTQDANGRVSIAGDTNTRTLSITGNTQPNISSLAGVPLFVATQDSSSANTDAINLYSGGVNSGAFNSGGISIFSGDNSGSGNTGDILIASGSGAATVGNVTIASGAGSVGGNIIVDSSASTAANIQLNSATTVNVTNADLIIDTVTKGLQIKSGTDAKIGTATLVAGTVTVSNASVTANSQIFVTSQVDGGTPGFLRVNNKIVGTSFDIVSSSATDTSTVAWVIIESIP